MKVIRRPLRIITNKMPGYKGHLTIGAIVFALISITSLYYSYIDIYSILIALPLFMLYTLLSDVDTPASKIRKFVEVSLLIIILILLLVFDQTKIAALLVLIILVFWKSKHRGVFHKPLMGFPLALPVVAYDTSIGLICFIGFITHIAADKLFKN